MMMMIMNNNYNNSNNNNNNKLHINIFLYPYKTPIKTFKSLLRAIIQRKRGPLLFKRLVNCSLYRPCKRK